MNDSKISTIEVYIPGAEEVLRVDVHDTEAGEICVANWEPGNSTRYVVAFVPLFTSLVKAAGFSFGDQPTWLVTWLIPGYQGSAFMFSSNNDDVLDFRYVHEKLCSRGMGSAVDASELTRVIGFILGRCVGLCTDGRGRRIDGGVEFDFRSMLRQLRSEMDRPVPGPVCH